MFNVILLNNVRLKMREKKYILEIMRIKQHDYRICKSEFLVLIKNEFEKNKGVSTNMDQ